MIQVGDICLFKPCENCHVDDTGIAIVSNVDGICALVDWVSSNLGNGHRLIPLDHLEVIGHLQ